MINVEGFMQVINQTVSNQTFQFITTTVLTVILAQKSSSQNRGTFLKKISFFVETHVSLKQNV